MVASAPSMLEEELERLRLEVWLVLTLALSASSAVSMLPDELERFTLDV